MRNRMLKQTVQYPTRLLGLDGQAAALQAQREREQFFICNDEHLDLKTGITTVDANGHILNQEQIVAGYVKKLHEIAFKGMIGPNEITFITFPIKSTEEFK